MTVQFCLHRQELAVSLASVFQKCLWCITPVYKILTKEDDSDSITDVNFKAYIKHGVGGL